MLDNGLDYTGVLCFVAFLTVLLILAALRSKKAPPCGDGGLLATFSSGWLALAPDDVRRLEIAPGASKRRNQELLARYTREYNSKFGDAISRVRRGVRVCPDGASSLYRGESGPGPTHQDLLNP